MEEMAEMEGGMMVAEMAAAETREVLSRLHWIAA